VQPVVPRTGTVDRELYMPEVPTVAGTHEQCVESGMDTVDYCLRPRLRYRTGVTAESVRLLYCSLCLNRAAVLAVVQKNVDAPH
jgi:hypothetical protein